jgi:hypothetical protein
MPRAWYFGPHPPNYVIGWALTIFFLLLGLAFVLGGPGSRDWVGPEIVGVVLLLLAAFCIRAMATSVLIATPAELVYWYWTRRRSVEMTEIQSFRVGPGRSRVRRNWRGLALPMPSLGYEQHDVRLPCLRRTGASC